jgi:hypothetical protein
MKKKRRQLWTPEQDAAENSKREAAPAAIAN